jgi:uncharacterized protein YegP (UPF0339 family)
MAARYDLKRSGDQFHFTLTAGNGETLLSSERYTSRQNALNGIESVRENAPLDTRYARKDASNGAPMFNLKAANSQIIGTSETYSSVTKREDGIQSVKVNAPGATVNDLT